ncbi:MAG TPA: hypothetical protein VIK04_21730 [Solirubrobacteraceae bacterium]
MTAAQDSQLRTLAFGDVDGGIWGAAVSGAHPAVAFGDATGGGATPGVLEASWSPDGRGWRLSGDGFDLHVEPAGEDPKQAAAADETEAVSGFQELCRVQGTITLSAAARSVDCVGTRCVIEGVDAGSLGSARSVSGWFADDDAFTLLALRAAEGVGQEADLIAATLFDPEGWVPVSDPRLSTTYAGSGRPARANLELWIGEGENEFPRRASGEASGAGVAAQAAGLALQVIPLRCHSRGREGAGVYVLATF